MMIMNRIKKYIAGFLLLTVVLLCYGTVVTSSEELTGQGSVYMLYQTDEPLDGKNALQRQEQNSDSENPLTFTLWGYQEQEAVSHQEFSREIETGIVHICGSSRLLFGAENSLELGDQQGCLVSQDVADKLYGNQKIKGSILTYNGTDYTIRGVIADAAKTVVLQADEKTKAILDATAFQISGESESEVLQTYRNRYGGSEKSIKLSTFSDWGTTAAGLLIWLVGLGLLIPALKTGFKLRREPVKCLVWTAAAALLMIVYWQVGKGYLSISFTASPPMWSDFSYWQEYFTSQGETIRELLMIEKRPPEQLYVDNWIKTMGYTVISAAAFLIGTKKWRLNTLWDVYLYCVISIILCFAAIQLTQSRILAQNYSYWLFLPVYFAGSYLLQVVKAKFEAEKIQEVKLLP